MSLHLQAQIIFVNQDHFYMKIIRDTQCGFLATTDNIWGNIVTLIKTKKESKMCVCDNGGQLKWQFKNYSHTVYSQLSALMKERCMNNKIQIIQVSGVTGSLVWLLNIEVQKCSTASNLIISNSKIEKVCWI